MMLGSERRAYATILATLVVVAALAAACGPSDGELARGRGGGLSVGEALGGDGAADEGFRKALEVRDFEFPRDHGPHEGFRTEWWYFTGNLSDDAGRPYGFQLTIFRQALTPEPTRRPSAWASNQLYFAHLALGEGEAGRFRASERFSRAALGLAGARAEPFRVWVEDWSAASVSGEATFPVRLEAAGEGFGIDLVVEPRKPPVFQGDQGLSAKGPEPGDASYYYSYTRLAARGAVVVDGERRPVEGLAWLDREWSTSVLGESQVGWDWFAIQLEDGRDLMAFQLRRSDGRPDPHNAGILVDSRGRGRVLGAEDLAFEPLDTWTSPASGARYPVAWRLRVRPAELTLTTEPMLRDSELDVSIRYWEGAIRVRGEGPRGAVQGRGFLEMTGYDGSGPGPVR
jgi:predicted secreted hydrolase